MKNMQSSQTLATLASGASLVAAIIQKLGGSDATREVAGSPLTKATICSTAMAVFEQEMGSSQVNTPTAYKG